MIPKAIPNFKHKTSLCRYYKSGRCTKDFCPYAHGTEELRPHNHAMPQNSQNYENYESPPLPQNNRRTQYSGMQYDSYANALKNKDQRPPRKAIGNGRYPLRTPPPSSFVDKTLNNKEYSNCGYQDDYMRNRYNFCNGPRSNGYSGRPNDLLNGPPHRRPNTDPRAYEPNRPGRFPPLHPNHNANSN
eukprot:Platyproteum_vivax@DN11950_c0_g1_i1.p1